MVKNAINIRSIRPIISVKSLEDRIFDSITYTFLALFTLLCILPIIRTVSMAFSSESSVMAGEVILWPKELTLSGIKYVLKDGSFKGSFIFTVILVLTYVLISMTLTVFTAYPLSKKYLRFRKTIMFGVIFTMLFNGGIIPSYLIVKNLNLINTMWALIIPCAMNAFNLIVMINFFKTIPDSIEESAKIDGASNLTILVKIVLPLSTASLATLTLFYAVSRWNLWFDALLYVNERKFYTLQMILREIILSSDPSLNADRVMNSDEIATQQVQAAALVLSTAPIVVSYPFLQKYFVKGVTLGGVKG